MAREKVNKRTSSAARLDEGNLIGDRLVDLGEGNYWQNKNIGTKNCFF